MVLEIAQQLCQGITGSKCNAPRLSDWKLVAPSTNTISIDVADVATAGAGAVAPINVKASGGMFVCGLQNDRTRVCTGLRGFGGGAGVGLGWGIPFVGGKAAGSISKTALREMVKKVGGSIQGKLVSEALDAVAGAAGMGVSGGTRIVAGPDAGPALSPVDFVGIVSMFSLGANFVVNGVSAGVAIFGSRPMVDVEDLIHAKGFALFGAVGLAASLEVEVSGLHYKVAIG